MYTNTGEIKDLNLKMKYDISNRRSKYSEIYQQIEELKEGKFLEYVFEIMDRKSLDTLRSSILTKFPTGYEVKQRRNKLYVYREVQKE